jgi:hypothetical protein
MSTLPPARAAASSAASRARAFSTLIACWLPSSLAPAPAAAPAPAPGSASSSTTKAAATEIGPLTENSRSTSVLRSAHER